MDTKNAPGRDLHSEDENARRAAASTMGKARTEKKITATRANIGRINEARKAEGFPEETREKLRAAQAVRREREKQERAALGLGAAPAEKKKVGRPAKPRPDVETAPRPRGRPKRQDGQTVAGLLDAPETTAEGQESA